MRALWARISRHRRLLARAVGVVALLVVALELWPNLPRDTEVEFALGPAHTRIVELRVAYVQHGEELHGVSFRWQEGAPEAVRHSIRLPSGEFQVRCELRTRDGSSVSVQRRLDTPTEGLVRFHLDAQTTAERRSPKEAA